LPAGFRNRISVEERGMISRHIWRSVCATAAIALVCGAATAFAQNVTTGSIHGTVADPQGAVLPGTSVAATHNDTGTKYETVTGPDGTFQVLNARIGAYTVSASLSGFKTQTRSNIVVQLGETETADFKLTLQTLTETVTVTAALPVIDTTRAGTAANISKDSI
jgi:hypothetical protein